MKTRLSILGSSGDITVTWDHDDPESREDARKEVERLRELGYTFFLVDGTPADEVTAGQGQLVVKRLTAEELIEPGADGPGADEPGANGPTADEPAGQSAGDAAGESGPPKRRRGRPKGVTNKGTADRHAVAVRPLRGG